MTALFLFALASTWPAPTRPQFLCQRTPSLVGMWKGTAVLSTSDSVTFTVVFQPNAAGYWVGDKRSFFTYSFSKPNLLKLSSAGKARLYSIQFLTADKFHILSYPAAKGDVEEMALVETVIFRRQ